ncbi:MAG TPA: HsdR family type I site-specific deoxyribonuclease [Chthoniobacterales bacterium]
MSTPSFLESHISQIPAIRLLQQLGYTYLGPEEVAVERRGRLSHVLLENVLANQLRRLNRISSRGRETAFTEENIAGGIAALRDIPFDGLVRTSEKIYDLLTLGKSLEQTVEDDTKGRTLRYVDWTNPHNNVFHVTAEFEVERTGSHETRRPDVVCFVNGIPFVVIECKRPDEKDSLEAAIEQSIRNWQADEIPHLFFYTQVTLALNKNEGSYGTTGTAIKFWSKWREMRDVDTEVRAAINSPVRREDHEKLFKGVFAYAKTAFEEMAALDREPTEQDRLLWSLCQPERLIEMGRQFVLYDEGGAVKKVARYQQYFAIRKTLERVRQRDAAGRRKGGVIWQTQGSGKSLAMVLLGKALALDEGIKNPRIVLVTDRIDLDEQIWKTFHQCGKDPRMAKTGRHLQELLADDRVAVITTVLDKFRAAANASEEFTNTSDNIFVLVDESHRSQYGEANIRMMRALPNACFIGFTGTPLMKREKNTAQKFGGFIEPAYTIRDAVADEAVVPLLYEGRHVMQDVKKNMVDTMFEAMCEELTVEQKADLKRKFASRDELNRLESRLYLIAWDVSQHFSAQWKGTGFKAQLTAPGKKEALTLKRFLDQFGKIASEVVISAPDDREGDDAASTDETVVRFWKGMMAKYGSEKEYNRQIINGFKKGDEPEIIIVVDKLLTGFDAPRNIVLYIARSLKEHALLQAIARVNRLHPGKDFGHIIDYYGVVTQLHEALELYSALEGKFDQEDLEGTLTDVAEELKRLPGLHDALWDLFREVRNKKDEEGFELALEKPEHRDEFYTRLSKFCRALKLALASIHWLTATPAATADRYKRDAVFFQKLRASVKIRYAEEVDYRDYEQQIQKMLTTYVQADEVIQVVEPVNIFEREAFEKEVDKARSPRAKADIIANRTKKTITEKMDEDPFFYRKFSVLLELAIADYKAQRISEAEYLAKVTDLMQTVRDGRTHDAPSVLKERDLSRAFFGTLKEQIGHAPINLDDTISVVREDSPTNGRKAAFDPVDELLASAACQIEDIIRKHAVVRWRENADAQNRMRNDLDDFLFALQDEKGIRLTLVQMDAIIESALRIARNRTNDV